MSADEPHKAAGRAEIDDDVALLRPVGKPMRNLRPNTTGWTIPSTFVPVYEIHFGNDDEEKGLSGTETPSPETPAESIPSETAENRQGGEAPGRRSGSSASDRNDGRSLGARIISDLHSSIGETAAADNGGLAGEDEDEGGNIPQKARAGANLRRSRAALSIFQDPQQVGHSEKSLSSAGTLQNTDTVAIAKALHSNVGVIDKAAIVLAALETGPATLVELTNRSGLSRPTAHRIATALEVHHFVDRNNDGRFVLGARFAQLAVAAGNDRLIAAGIPILQSLHDRTGESAQIYRRHEGQRICIASVERTTGLRDSVPVGTRLSLAAGAASHVLLAWEPSENLRGFLSRARFGNKALADVRRRDWAESVDERETGVSSVAAPIRNASGQIVAAINLSGPSERMGEHPGHLYAPVVLSAAKHLSDDISHAGL